MAVAAVICLGWLLSICLHEFGHALVAYWGGDTSVKDKGYLTLNVFKYTDPQVTLIFPVIVLVLGGIPLPGAAVYINRGRLRNRFWSSAVSAAGPYASMVTAVLFALPFLFDVKLPGAEWLMTALATLVFLQVLSVIFNLLPMPGLDGFGVISPWLPKSMQQQAAAFSQYSLWLLLAAIWFLPGFNGLLWGGAYIITTLFGVPAELVGHGFDTFMAQRVWIGVILIGSLFLVYRRNKKPGSNESFTKARQFLAQNQPEEALKSVDDAIQLQPSSPEAWHLRALCLGLLNKNEEAIGNFNRALALKPDYADCWYNKACCYALQGQKEAALASLGHAMSINNSAELKVQARKDVGFQSMQDDPRFQRLTATELSQP